jgi:hypothetical protein
MIQLPECFEHLRLANMEDKKKDLFDTMLFLQYALCGFIGFMTMRL